MSMKLSILERLLLTNQILPKNGNFVDLLAIEAAQDKLKLTEEEIEYLDPITDKDTGNIDFTKDTSDPVEIELAPRQMTIIETQLLDMEKAKPPKLGVQHISLYKKFVEAAGDSPEK